MMGNMRGSLRQLSCHVLAPFVAPGTILLRQNQGSLVRKRRLLIGVLGAVDVS